MTSKFDELTKAMAQSVTRRAALKKFGLGLAGLGLAKLGVHQAQAITNGTLDGDAHPNVGGVVWLVSPRPATPPPVVCGSGTLIHPRVYLTTGHGTFLVESMAAQGALTVQDDILVSFADDDADPATWRAVSGILTHPDFVPQTSSSADVGVLILKDPVRDLPLVPLPPQGFLNALAAADKLKTGSDGARFAVVGYGVEPGKNPGQLPFPPDGLRRVAYAEFQNLHDRWLYTDQKVAHDNGGSCNCDSGGPLFHVDPVTGQETLVAVVSRGSLSTSHDYRVDTEEALSFLNAVIAMVEAGGL